VVADADTAVTGDGGCCIGSTIAPLLPAFNTARSVEAWVKPLDSYTRWLAGWGTNTTARVFDVGVAGDTVLVAGYADDLSFPVGHSLVDGAWHHIVASYDGSAATVYVDGVAIGTRAFPAPLNTVTNGFLRVGAAVAGDSPVYGGLDELAVYPSALTAAQVSAHFAAAGHRAPGVPTAVTATPVTNGVSVSWTAPTAVVDGITRYVVTALRAGVPVNAVATSGSATSAVITGLPAGTGLTVKVVAGNTYGDGPAGASAAVTPIGTSTTTYASSVLADAPSAFYRLGEATGTLVGADSSGRAPLLTYSQVALGATGALPHDVDTGATANGSCCIGSAPATQLPRFNSARTVEAWVKPTDTYGRWVAGWGTTATDRAFDVGIDGTDVLVSEYAGDLTFPIGHTLVDGAWHHLAVTYDGTSVRAYVDGVALAAQTFPAALNTTSSVVLEIGAGAGGASPAYGGVDDVAIYPSALTPARIAAHYAAR
jgi:Concanavalin A-like lectin/glucanases superfamily/Fibronectin type III domain